MSGAGAGIQPFQLIWTPAFAGVTVKINEIFLNSMASYRFETVGNRAMKNASVMRLGTSQVFPPQDDKNPASGAGEMGFFDSIVIWLNSPRNRVATAGQHMIIRIQPAFS